MCLKLFMLPDLIISSESFFHNNGLPYDALFKPIFDFLNCFLTFEKMAVYVFYWVQQETIFH